MDNLVVKSNHVIEAGYRLTLNEQRLVLLCIQQIKKGQHITADTSFCISAKEFAEVFDVSQKRAYTELKNVSETLFNRFLTIHKPDPEKPKLVQTRTRWITAIDYIPSEGQIMLYFASKVIPYISLLESGFTRYSIEYIVQMNSVYGVRFYELFKCWLMGDKSKIKSIGLDELKELLDLKDDKGVYQYPSIKDFKLKVLDRGLEDVNQHTDLQAAYEAKKTGRRITHLEFVIKLKNEAKPSRKALSQTKHPLPPDAELETIDKPMTKEEAQQAKEALLTALPPLFKQPNPETMTKEEVEQEFESLKTMAEEAKSEDVLGFIVRFSSKELKEVFKKYKLM